VPRHLERHARSRSDWDTQPARSAERAAAAAEPAGKAPGRKDRWARCKGARGAAHVLAITPRDLPGSHHPARDGCRWYPFYEHKTLSFRAGWSCRHHEACVNCGKESRYSVSTGECPVFPGTTEQQSEAEAEAWQMSEHHADRWRRRKPVITGPQGYRRQKAGKA
jgi:hypothetical protein